nr:MAG TPA: hypothetical protein [Caudoviricetes sp.]
MYYSKASLLIGMTYKHFSVPAIKEILFFIVSLLCGAGKFLD